MRSSIEDAYTKKVRALYVDDEDFTPLLQRSIHCVDNFDKNIIVNGWNNRDITEYSTEVVAELRADNPVNMHIALTTATGSVSEEQGTYTFDATRWIGETNLPLGGYTEGADGLHNSGYFVALLVNESDSSGIGYGAVRQYFKPYGMEIPANVWRDIYTGGSSTQYGQYVLNALYDIYVDWGENYSVSVIMGYTIRGVSDYCFYKFPGMYVMSVNFGRYKKDAMVLVDIYGKQGPELEETKA